MEIFYEIINLYNEINNIYLSLSKLEVQGNERDSYFMKMISILKNKLNIEKELFDELFFVYNYDYNMICRIINTKITFFDNHIRRRMLDYINMYECINGVQDLSDEEVNEQVMLDKLYISCSRNMYLIYYSFLQEYIDLRLFKNLKEELVDFKYYNSFVDHDMESQLVNNNFNVPKINYIIVNIVADTLRIKLGEDAALDCYANIILTSLIELLCIKDVDYSDDNKKAISVNNQCMLRAGLSMLNDSDYYKLIVDINDKIKKYDIGDNGISIQVVNSIIDRRIKDKERVRKLSLIPLKD